MYRVHNLSHLLFRFVNLPELGTPFTHLSQYLQGLIIQHEPMRCIDNGKLHLGTMHVWALFCASKLAPAEEQFLNYMLFLFWHKGW